MSEKKDEILEISKSGEETVKLVHFDGGERYECKFSGGLLAVIIDGRLILEDDKSSTQFDAKKIVFVNPGTDYGLTVPCKTKVLFFSIRWHIHYFEKTLSDSIPAPGRQANTGLWGFKSLHMKQPLELFARTVSSYYTDGILDRHLLEIKMRELIFLMQALYEVEELGDFFGSIPSADYQFMHLVLANRENVRTVNEYARMANMSISSFEKKFKGLFGTSPYQWMKRQKAERLLDSLMHSDKPLKQLCDELGFSSGSQMIDFCKREWGLAPGRIRQSHRMGYKLQL